MNVIRSVSVSGSSRDGMQRTVVFHAAMIAPMAKSTYQLVHTCNVIGTIVI